MNHGKLLKKVGSAAIVAALLVVATSAGAVPLSPPLPFTISEGSIPGSLALSWFVDRFSHTFSSSGFVGVGGGDLSGSDDPFTQGGNAIASTYLLGTTPVITQLNQLPILGIGYALYATFTATGESDLIPGPPIGVLGIYSSASFSIFIDPLQNTILPAGSPIPGPGAGEDIPIATATLAPAALCAPDPSCGIGHTFPGLAAGDFAFLLDFTLTPAGALYFGAPSPFHTLMSLTGVTSDASGAFAGPFTTEGSGDAYFTGVIPAPASLLLLGLGLIGGAVAVRRARLRAR